MVQNSQFGNDNQNDFDWKKYCPRERSYSIVDLIINEIQVDLLVKKGTPLIPHIKVCLRVLESTFALRLKKSCIKPFEASERAPRNLIASVEVKDVWKWK